MTLARIDYGVNLSFFFQRTHSFCFLGAIEGDAGDQKSNGFFSGKHKRPFFHGSSTTESLVFASNYYISKVAKVLEVDRCLEGEPNFQKTVFLKNKELYWGMDRNYWRAERGK